VRNTSRRMGGGGAGVVDISEIDRDEEVTEDGEIEDEMAEEDIEVGGKGISSGLMYSETAGVSGILTGTLTSSTLPTAGSTSTSKIRLRGVPNSDGMVSNSEGHISAVRYSDSEGMPSRE
jgi:hypothetical protein